jgi:hypothetical protein
MENPKQEKPKVTVEKIVVSPKVEWDLAVAAIAELKAVLDFEIESLRAKPEIKNAYSPITWHKLCRQVLHVTEGMAAVRLSIDGWDAGQIQAMTGIHQSRTAAFKAWNTRWVRAIRHTIEIRWAKAEERIRDIAWLKSIGISVDDTTAVTND